MELGVEVPGTEAEDLDSTAGTVAVGASTGALPEPLLGADAGGWVDGGDGLGDSTTSVAVSRECRAGGVAAVLALEPRPP